MKKTIIVLLLGSILLTACGFYPPNGTSSPGVGTNTNNGNYTSNGERIYFTAIDQNGNPIPSTGGPAYGGTAGETLACVSCHGPQGRGSSNLSNIQWIDARPIYYSALVQMLQDEAGGTPQPGGYTLDDFRKAVVEGEHPNGVRLNPNMPRWQMDDADLADLFEFLKTLP
jgi:cytochrome c oxidase subunit II